MMTPILGGGGGLKFKIQCLGEVFYLPEWSEYMDATIFILHVDC